MTRLAAVIAVLLSIVACGDDDSGGAVDDTTSTIVVETDVEAAIGERSVVSTSTTDPAAGPTVPPVGEAVEVRLVEPTRSEATFMTWVLEVENVGDTPVTLTFPTAQRADVVLLDGEAVVHRWSDDQFFDQTVTTVELAGREIDEFELPDDLSALPPGRYSVEIRLAIIDPPPPDEGTFRVVSS